MLTLKIQSQGGGEREAEWEGERLWNESEAKRLAQSLTAKQFDVVEATSAEKSKARPVEGVSGTLIVLGRSEHGSDAEVRIVLSGRGALAGDAHGGEAVLAGVHLVPADGEHGVPEGVQHAADRAVAER